MQFLKAKLRQNEENTQITLSEVRLSSSPIAFKFPNCQSFGHHQLSHFCLLHKDSNDDDDDLIDWFSDVP